MARKIGSRYTAHQVLGRGSAGTVWLGEGPEGPVAIKLLREDLASDQDLVGRFVQERAALLSLDHPRIVGIRDLVVDGSDLALVMDLVRGSDLRSRLERERSFRPETAVAIAADVADALAAAHAAGVVHRDVKPENVLLDAAAPPGPGGAPPALLTDFGIARLVDAPRRTRATRIIGTPDYLAPEIIEGLPPRASVDIYALATVLYELLAGFTPFGGGHPGAVLRRHVTETVVPLPGVPEGLWQILAQCLAKAPASRLTAAELADRLRERLPELAGLPALEVAAPDGAAAEEEPAAERAQAERQEPAHGTRRGAVPLVRGSVPDSSRETHTSIKLPTADELAAYPHRGTGPRHRAAASAEALRRRRIKLAAAVAAAAVAAGLGGWAVASSGDGAKANTREDTPGPGTASHATPSAPAAGVPSPQGSTATAAALPQWSAFQDAPQPATPLTGGPRAIALSGTTYVFARGADGNIWYLTRDTASGHYGRWQRLSGIHVAGDPAVVSAQTGHLDLFALGTDGLLYRRTMAGGLWGQWYQVDERTRFDSAPAAASSEPGRIDLVGRTGGDLITASLVDGRWNAWALVPTAGRITGAPGLLSAAPGTLDAFVVRKADGAVLRLPFADGAWRPSQVVGHLDATGRPEAALYAGRLYLFAPSDGGGLTEAVGPRDAGDPGNAGSTSEAGDSGGGQDGDWSAAALAAPADPGSAAGPLGYRTGMELWVRTSEGGLARAFA